MKKNLIFMILFLCAFILFAGCNTSRKVLRKEVEHFTQTGPLHRKTLKEELRRKVDHMIAEINGPLKRDIQGFLYYQIMQVGPLFYYSREFAEGQLEKAKEIPDQVAAHLQNQVEVHFKKALDQINRYGRAQIEEFPKLTENYSRFLRYRKKEIDRFVRAVNRYNEINTEMIGELSISIEKYLEWQKEKPQAIPDATERYIDKMARDFDAVMSTTGRLFDYNLKTLPQRIKKDIFRYTRYNTGEVLERLGRSTGRYLWKNAEISDMAKELHCFANRNIEETAEIMNSVQRYFSLNAEHTKKLNKSVSRFFRWRTQEWIGMKSQLDRFISHNVEKYEDFKKTPIEYLRHQKEEWEKLKETVPRYFLSNLGRTEGLEFALRRYFHGNF